MLTLLAAPFVFLRGLLRHRAGLAAENLALRQQLAIFKHQNKRPRLRNVDRIFWVWLSKLRADWRSSLIVITPDTVTGWHRLGFKLYWAAKSKPQKPGRPPVDSEIRKQIRRMARENPLWRTPRIASELKLLGFTVSGNTVKKYMPKTRKPPSPGWRTFLETSPLIPLSLPLCYAYLCFPIQALYY